MKDRNLVKWASWPPTTVKSLTEDDLQRVSRRLQGGINNGEPVADACIPADSFGECCHFKSPRCSSSHTPAVKGLLTCLFACHRRMFTKLHDVLYGQKGSNTGRFSQDALLQSCTRQLCLQCNSVINTLNLQVCVRATKLHSASLEDALCAVATAAPAAQTHHLSYCT